MNLRMLCFAQTVLFAASILNAQTVVEFQGHFYQLTANMASWEEAEQEAIALGGHLVAINSQAENDFIREQFTGPETPSIWLGLSDSAEEGSFVWANGDPFDFQNWAPGEPNDFPPGEDLVVMGQDGRWNDVSSDALFGVVELVPALETERESLIAFYLSTNGDDWTDNQGWKSAPVRADGFNEDPCLAPIWFGVTCSNGHVTALVSQSNNLTGTLPGELGELAELELLNLDNNDLQGPIPANLGKLSKLQTLRMSFNRLEGPIPAEVGNLSNLFSLSLFGNQLSGELPAELGDLKKVQDIQLGQNQLSGSIPPELATLPNMFLLELTSNRLSGPIPPELSQAPNLALLYLRNNRLSGEIPPELGQAMRLTELDIANNRLVGPLPDELGQAENLEYLDLTGNQLEGSIPDSLGNLAALENLRLAYNELYGEIPENLGDLANLRELTLQGNHLSGSIPASLGQLQLLQSLNLSRNQLSGPIPEELGQLAEIQTLNLSSNRISGEVPASLTMLPEDSLDLRQNRLQSVADGLDAELNTAHYGDEDWESSQHLVEAYPQLVLGGGFEAILLVSNFSRENWHGRAYLNGGRWPESTAWTLNQEDRSGTSDFEIDLPPFATARFVMGAGMDAAVGWLILRSENESLPEDVSVSFFYNLSGDEELLDSTGVDGAPLSDLFFFPVEKSSDGIDTGVAVRATRGTTIFQLLDQQGRTVDFTGIDGDRALLLGDLFPDLPPDFVGSVAAFSNTRGFFSVPNASTFFLTVLRLEVTDTGVQLTSVPALPRHRIRGRR